MFFTNNDEAFLCGNELIGLTFKYLNETSYLMFTAAASVGNWFVWFF